MLGTTARLVLDSENPHRKDVLVHVRSTMCTQVTSRYELNADRYLNSLGSLSYPVRLYTTFIPYLNPIVWFLRVLFCLVVAGTVGFSEPENDSYQAPTSYLMHLGEFTCSCH